MNCTVGKDKVTFLITSSRLLARGINPELLYNLAESQEPEAEA